MPGTIGDETVSRHPSPRRAVRRQPSIDVPRLTPFDGYPYLMIRIGHTALRSVSLLPAEWPRHRLENLAARQVAANRLYACLCLAPNLGVNVWADGSGLQTSFIPAGVPLVDRLRLPEPIPQSPEIVARHDRLLEFADARAPKHGYLVGDGLEGGRPATREDRGRLSQLDASGIPAGLARCPDCGEFRGDYLAVKGEGNGDQRPRVIEVHCACQNHNRCAACGEPLAESRLSAYSYDETTASVWYLAAYAGLRHRCVREDMAAN